MSDVDYASRADAVQASIPASLTYLRTAGYATAGDGGGALYKKVALSSLSSGGKFASADGAIWEIADRSYIKAAQYGAFGVNGTDCSAQLAQIVADLLPGGTLALGPGVYYGNSVNPVLLVNTAIRVVGCGLATVIRQAGPGSAAIFDGVNTVSGLTIDRVTFATDPGGGYGLLLRSCGRIHIGQIWVPSCGSYAIRFDGSTHIQMDSPIISTSIAFSEGVSDNYTAGPFARPAGGIYFSDYQPVGQSNHPSSHNIIIGPDISGLNESAGVGLYFAGNAAHNLILAGNAAACRIGVHLGGPADDPALGKGAQLNTFIDFVMEGNTVVDIDGYGSMNVFYNCQGNSQPDPQKPDTLDARGAVFQNGSYLNQIIGGRYYRIDIGASATGNAVRGAHSYILNDLGNSTTIDACWDFGNSRYFPPTRTDVTFANGWQNHGSPSASVRYAKLSNGIIKLTGTMKSGTIGATAFNLPATYRPAADLYFVCPNPYVNQQTVIIKVSPDGTVTPLNGTNQMISVDNIQFIAEQ